MLPAGRWGLGGSGSHPAEVWWVMGESPEESWAGKIYPWEGSGGQVWAGGPPCLAPGGGGTWAQSGAVVGPRTRQGLQDTRHRPFPAPAHVNTPHSLPAPTRERGGGCSDARNGGPARNDQAHWAPASAVRPPLPAVLHPSPAHSPLIHSYTGAPGQQTPGYTGLGGPILEALSPRKEGTQARQVGKHRDP